MCEIYNNLTDYRILDVNKEPICRHQVDCGQTAETCKFRELLAEVDRKSMCRAETEEDREQDRILAELEAKNSQKEVSGQEIAEQNRVNSLICIGRVN